MIHLIKTLALLLCLALPAWAGDPVIIFDEDDPDMNAAINAARTTLDQLLTHALNSEGIADPETTLKVSFPVSSDQMEDEVICVDHIKRNGPKFTGRLANSPVAMDGFQHGSSVTFTHSQINDWGVTGPNGKHYGHYTTRIMIPQLSADQAASVKDYLSSQPLPKSW